VKAFSTARAARRNVRVEDVEVHALQGAVRDAGQVLEVPR
jgi:hypothetical protein